MYSTCVRCVRCVREVYTALHCTSPSSRRRSIDLRLSLSHSLTRFLACFLHFKICICKQGISVMASFNWLITFFKIKDFKILLTNPKIFHVHLWILTEFTKYAHRYFREHYCRNNSKYLKKERETKIKITMFETFYLFITITVLRIIPFINTYNVKLFL